MDLDHIRIVMNGVGKGDIWVNGQKLKGTYGFHITGENNEPTRVSVTFMAPDIDIECDGVLVVNEEGSDGTS